MQFKIKITTYKTKNKSVKCLICGREMKDGLNTVNSHSLSK